MSTWKSHHLTMTGVFQWFLQKIANFLFKYNLSSDNASFFECYFIKKFVFVKDLHRKLTGLLCGFYMKFTSYFTFLLVIIISFTVLGKHLASYRL